MLVFEILFLLIMIFAVGAMSVGAAMFLSSYMDIGDTEQRKKFGLRIFYIGFLIGTIIAIGVLIYDFLKDF